MAELPPAPSPTVDAIYAAYEAAQESGYREHLGASIIGTDCDRAVWYSFRWTTRAKFSGRMLRLFETGQLEEARLVANLRRVGVTVLEIDPDTGRQWACRDDTGHFGGSADAVALGLLEAPKTWHLCEFKTHNDKSFQKLKKDKVEKSKPQHYAQMQSYMHLMQLERAFYMARNKDTDEIYNERLSYDAAYAARLLAKAGRIIHAAHPPGRISQDPSWYQCRFCDHAPQCHHGTLPERHCRSCLHSSPAEGGAWNCVFHQCQLTRAEQESGCEHHRYIPDLVHADQVNIDGETVIYLLRSGAEWRDEGTCA
jgi:hypothetical protein